MMDIEFDYEMLMDKYYNIDFPFILGILDKFDFVCMFKSDCEPDAELCIRINNQHYEINHKWLDRILYTHFKLYMRYLKDEYMDDTFPKAYIINQETINRLKFVLRMNVPVIEMRFVNNTTEVTEYNIYDDDFDYINAIVDKILS